MSCFKCKINFDDKIDPPGIRFNWLYGDPFVCEKCAAMIFGIVEAEWKNGIMNLLEDKDEIK